MYFDYLILKIMKTLVRSLEVVTFATSLPKKIECEPECVINSCCCHVLVSMTLAVQLCVMHN